MALLNFTRIPLMFVIPAPAGSVPGKIFAVASTGGVAGAVYSPVIAAVGAITNTNGPTMGTTLSNILTFKSIVIPMLVNLLAFKRNPKFLRLSLKEEC